MNLSLGLSLSNRVVPSEPAEELGPERVVNGGFDTDSDWSGSNWSISGGTANAATAAFARVCLNTGPLAETGKTYRCTFTVTSISAGAVRIGYSAQGTDRTAPGTYSEDLVAIDSASAPSLRAAANTTASVDNVSVKEVLP